MINPQWLKLPMFRINFHGSKYIRAIEVLLYFEWIEKNNIYADSIVIWDMAAITILPGRFYSQPSLYRHSIQRQNSL